MSARAWHAPAGMLAAYADEELDPARASSLEAHLLACEGCRARLRAAFPPGDVERMWAGIAARTDAVIGRPLERGLVRAGLPDHVARLLAATPSLTGSWFLAVGIALAFSVLSARAGAAGFAFFLTLAPLVPLAGVAVAYGPGVDPAYEIAVAAPMRSFRLVLIRAVAVLATSCVITGGAALLLPDLDWRAAAWLLPALALATASLALSTWWPALPAFGTVAGGWVAGVAVTESAARVPLAAFRGWTQLACAAVAVAGAIVLGGRRAAFDRGRPA